MRRLKYGGTCQKVRPLPSQVWTFWVSSKFAKEFETKI